MYVHVCMHVRVCMCMHVFINEEELNAPLYLYGRDLSIVKTLFLPQSTCFEVIRPPQDVCVIRIYLN